MILSNRATCSDIIGSRYGRLSKFNIICILDHNIGTNDLDFILKVVVCCSVSVERHIETGGRYNSQPFHRQDSGICDCTPGCRHSKITRQGHGRQNYRSRRIDGMSYTSLHSKCSTEDVARGIKDNTIRIIIISSEPCIPSRNL